MSAGSEVAELRAAVAELRRRCRLLLVLALAGLAGVAGLLVRDYRHGLGRWGPDEARAVQVAAQEYHLLDPNGNLRGLWSCPPAGPALTLHDETGRVVLQLRQTDRGGLLRVSDAAGRVVFEVPEPKGR